MQELIVVVEDEPDLLELLEYNLRKEGFEVEGFLTPSRLEDFIEDEKVALLIMDRNLPGCDGLDVVKALRKKGFTTPVIFLTAKIEDKHKIEGFEAGADDYITKPFNIAELILRVKALMRRTGTLQEKITYRGITILPDAKQVFVDDIEIHLTKLEFNLLQELVQNKNSVLTRETLLYRVWEDEEGYQDRTVDVAIKRLKEKIDPTREKNYIISIRGIGYKLC